MFACVVLDLVF